MLINYIQNPFKNYLNYFQLITKCKKKSLQSPVFSSSKAATLFLIHTDWAVNRSDDLDYVVTNKT